MEEQEREKSNDKLISHEMYYLTEDCKFLDSLDGVDTLMNTLRSSRFKSKHELFPDLTEDEFLKSKSLSSSSINRIQSVISKLIKIVRKWNRSAELVPFGSVANGFCLEHSSDIDLTILVPSKLAKHPSTYWSELLEILDIETEINWEIIKTRNLFLITTNYMDGFSVDILFNNITGLINSEYVRTLAAFDGRFHKVGMYLK